MPSLYPQIEPYAQGMLEVTGGDLVYWEVCGNPRGKPAVVLHGGPGSGCTPWSRLTAACCRVLIPRFVNGLLLTGACGSP